MDLTALDIFIAVQDVICRRDRFHFENRIADKLGVTPPHDSAALIGIEGELAVIAGKVRALKEQAQAMKDEEVRDGPEATQ